jgi:hypothetical protein
MRVDLGTSLMHKRPAERLQLEVKRGDAVN